MRNEEIWPMSKRVRARERERDFEIPRKMFKQKSSSEYCSSCYSRFRVIGVYKNVIGLGAFQISPVNYLQRSEYRLKDFYIVFAAFQNIF